METNKNIKKVGRKKISAAAVQDYSLGMPAIVWIFIFCYLPMFGVIIAFKNYQYDKGILNSPWAGFENFKTLTLSNDFWIITRNTLWLNALFILFGTVAAVLLAVLLYELTSRSAAKVYQTIMITPNFLSWVVVGYMGFAILDPVNGVLNQFIRHLGGTAVDWYSVPKVWPSILTITSTWKSMGMDSVIYYAALMGIDKSLFESADLDGANKLQKTWYVTVPSIMSLIIIMTILKIGNIFRADFGLFYQMTRDVGILYAATDVIDTYIYRTMKEIGDMGVSSATGLLQSVVGFVLVIVTNTVVKKLDPDNALF